MGKTGGGGWGHLQGAVLMTAAGLAIKGPWLASGGPTIKKNVGVEKEHSNCQQLHIPVRTNQPKMANR